MGVAQSGKVAVPARLRGGPNQAGLDTHQCTQDLSLGDDLEEEPGEFFCQDSVPASEHRNQDCK